MTDSVSRIGSSQPEGSAGRVIAFCLALHRAEVAEPPRRRGAGALLPHRFTLTAAEAEAVYFLLPCSVARISAREVAVSDRPALWCPDFPHRDLRLLGAAIPPGLPPEN